MKFLMISAAVGALMTPAAAFAQSWTDADNHACLDETCNIVSLIETPQQSGDVVLGYQGTETPRYGAWGFDLRAHLVG